MNLAFLCASAAPGRDGVGDYTRRLADACGACGHPSMVLALHDREVTAGTSEEPAAHSRIHRWPAGQPWAERQAGVLARLQDFAPDWISWQMVAYGFHPKGILPPEVSALARALAGWRTHVMLHELWIGLARGESCRARWTGWRQRRALVAFLRAAAPERLFTSNRSYAATLARHGFETLVLPVFSNIPVIPASPAEQAAMITRHLPAGLHGDHLICATFGTLHPQWQPAATVRFVQATAARAGRQPVLFVLGRTGRHGATMLHRLADTGLPVVSTGELAPTDVSCLLQAADFGIAVHPQALINKSGAVAAMLDHGLPVLVPRDDWHLRTGPAPTPDADVRLARLADLTDSAADAWLHGPRAPQDSVALTTRCFLHALSA